MPFFCPDCNYDYHVTLIGNCYCCESGNCYCGRDDCRNEDPGEDDEYYPGEDED